jgi:hypothetical protein
LEVYNNGDKTKKRAHEKNVKEAKRVDEQMVGNNETRPRTLIISCDDGQVAVCHKVVGIMVEIEHIHTHLSEVEINELGLLVRDVAPKVPPHKHMPPVVHTIMV